MTAFVDEFGVGDFPHVADVDGAVWSTYRVTTQPAFAFIDDDGSLEVHVGTLGEDGLASRLEALVAT